MAIPARKNFHQNPYASQDHLRDINNQLEEINQKLGDEGESSKQKIGDEAETSKQKIGDDQGEAPEQKRHKKSGDWSLALIK